MDIQKPLPIILSISIIMALYRTPGRLSVCISISDNLFLQLKIIKKLTMKFQGSIIKNIKARKFILGIVVLIITMAVCLLIFRNWDYLKAIIRGG